MFGLLSAAARSRQKKKATYSDHILRHHTRIKIQKNKTENFGSKAQRRQHVGHNNGILFGFGCRNKGCQVLVLCAYAFKAKTNNVCVNDVFECISVSEIVKRTIMSDPRLKQIKIKTGVLKRVGKEKLSYRKEADQQKAKIEKMKEDNRDEVY